MRMSAVETQHDREQRDGDAVAGDNGSAPHGAPAAARRAVEGRGWTLAVAGAAAVRLRLRIWGVEHGLPYAYNADENAHFVPKAIGLFGHGLNPHYFVNPPAYTYVLHAVFAVWFGGREGISNAFAADPTEVFVVARVVAALIGTLAVWLLYLAGTRFFDRRVGLLAAGLLAVSFLPVFYSHLALNDVPTLAPICLSLWGTAGVLRFGRDRDYLIAGLGLGLAAATKYTGGIVLLPLLGAAAVSFGTVTGRRAAARGLVLAAGASIAGFLVANPYALLDFDAFRDGLDHQTTVADDALGKLGLTQDNGVLYYVWTLTWGMGYVPAPRRGRRRRVARARAAAHARRARPRADPLHPVHGLAGAVLRPLAAAGLPDRLPARRVARAARSPTRAAGAGRALRPTLYVLAVLALCGQGLVFSLHNGLVLSRPDTRNMTREWLVANVPPKTKIVVEPVVPDGWAQDIGNPSILTQNGNRWVKFPTSRSNILNDGTEIEGPGRVVNIEDYERTLTPELIKRYEDQGYCFVVSGSTQRGRAEVEPDVVPRALAYYRELERRAQKVYVASPYRKGSDGVDFNFDWSFDFYPLDYHRPGPLMQVFRLKGGQCAGIS